MLCMFCACEMWGEGQAYICVSRLVFLWSHSVCCIELNKRMSLVCKHGADPRSLASQTWRYALHMSLSHAALKRRGGSDSRALTVICSFSCVFSGSLCYRWDRVWHRVWRVVFGAGIGYFNLTEVVILEAMLWAPYNTGVNGLIYLLISWYHTAQHHPLHIFHVIF